MAEAEPVQLLEWDSAFWGVGIGRVAGDVLTGERRAAVDDWARVNSVECLYFLARSDDPDTIDVAHDAGFRLVDVRVEFTRPVERGPSSQSVRTQRSGDLPALRAIARASHENTRFFADPHFSRERCSDFYETWIEESCNGWADAVLVSERDGRVAGYVTCHLDDESHSASIGLIGVSADAREKGLGGELVSAALTWSSERSVTVLSVVTQGGNVPAQRLFQRFGFRTATVGLWFHKWYSA